MGFTYRTARAVMMVGSMTAAGGPTPRLIGPAHATIGTSGRRALCGVYVARDEEVPWPPEVTVVDSLCPMCSELALL
ncbi:MAG: uncharacterized protein JWR70_907 [Modestobacter sp.]|jgi:hypothetical protein|nr:uncharacterized protein [Modestobacter sp.]